MSATPSLYAFLHNMRLHTQQWLLPRAGLSAISNTPFDQLPVHSIKRLFDKVTNNFPRVYGAGTKLYVGEGTASVDVGFSGNPLALIPYRPEQSAQPWMYVADSFKMKKVRQDGLVHTIGFEPPLAAPTVGFGAPAFQVVSDFQAIGSWTNGGSAGAISVVSRVNTTVFRILYDAGSIGWANVSPTTMTSQIQKGMLIIVNTEEALVDEVYPGFGSSTIGSIAYDSGTTGLCTIQPAASACPKSHFPYQPGLGDGPRLPRYPGRGAQARATGSAVTSGNTARDGSVSPILAGPSRPGRPPVRKGSTRPLGIQPNSLVRINSGGGSDETVRVLSIAVGKNGIVSFRASTVNNHVAGETLTGLPSFRTFFNITHVNGDTITKSAFQSSIGPGTGFLSLVTPFNLSVAAGQPLQEDDEIHVSMQLDHPEFLSEARILFDVDSATNDFAHNYFYYAIRPSDAQQAVTGGFTNLQARQLALTRSVTSTYSRKINPRQLGPVYKDGDSTVGGGFDDVGVDPNFRPGGYIGTSAQATTGAVQWTEFRFKVSDLVRVGGDKSQTLANVAGVRIQFAVSSAVIAKIDSLWIGGSYGPDIGDIGAPIFYRTRGRSKITGVRSLAGPSTRSGIEPHRQRVVVTQALHPNPGVDTLDVFRFGGSLDQWYYIGSMPNTGSPSFNDDFDDTSVQTNPTLDLDFFQPFPTIDLPHSGVVNAVGHKIISVSGDTFNTQWYPGSQININGVFYTLYAQPSDTTHLEIVESAGTLLNVPWFMNNATLLGQPLPSFWGPYSEGTAAFFFACGDKFQPGVLFLTNGNDPDTASDTLQIEVCSPSEPLINGCMYDGTPYVFSSETLYRCYPNIGSGAQLFSPLKVPNSKGLFSRWALAVGRFMYALGKDGIYRTDGASYDSITQPDLDLLFPHEGQAGQPITIASVTIQPPDMTQLSKLRLSYYDDHLYFDFQDTNAVLRTLVYSELNNVWGVDDFTPSVLTHYGDEGENVHGMILGGNDGRAYRAQGTLDGTGANFVCEARFPQMSELATTYQLVPDGIFGLLSNSTVNLIINVDGVDLTLPLASTSGLFSRFYQRLPAFKGKLLAFGLSAAQAFSFDRRECQLRCGAWGRQQTAELISSGSMSPINPFADLRRSYGPKVT